MKIVGGPRDGQVITISETRGGPELQVEGSVLEYIYISHIHASIKLYGEANPKPSLPGLVERYRCHDGGWYYVDPPSGSAVQASPPIVME